MSIHINANRGDIADTVLLPGDPLRAKYIAETILEKSVCYNQVRGMLGFTGYYHNQRVSVQSTGMGMPSAAIYINELISQFGIKKMVRIGTTGGIDERIVPGDIVLALAAATDSSMPNLLFPDHHPALCPDAALLEKAMQLLKQSHITYHVGPIFTTDRFYADAHLGRDALQKTGMLAVDMETAVVYLLGLQHKVPSLSILTVSDHIITGACTDALTREQKFMDMVHIGLQSALD